MENEGLFTIFELFSAIKDDEKPGKGLVRVTVDKSLTKSSFSVPQIRRNLLEERTDRERSPL